MQRSPRGLRIGDPPAIASPHTQRTEQGLVIQAWAQAEGEGRSRLPRIVLTGVGGIGKTQMATAIFYELSPKLDLSLWVRARTTEEVVAAFAQVEDLLAHGGSPAHGSGGETVGNAKEYARRFMRRLEDKSALRNWLVVLDDMSAPEEEMEPWWPPVNDHGRTLVTSRVVPAYLAQRADTRLIVISALPFQESVSLLRSSLPDELSTQDAAAIDALARQSQGLPLALSQIASLLRDTPLSAEQVLHRLVDPERLAQEYAMSGRPAEAEDQLVTLLNAQEQVLAADDPSVLATRANLAAVIAMSGRVYEAQKILSRLLSDQQRVLGRDHPTTLTTRANLARLYGQAGDVEYAIAELRELLADQQRVLGGDHPTTLTTRANLAQLYGQAGNTEYAIAELRELLADQQRVLGGDHPTTLTTRANLAQLYGQAGNTEYAIAELRELLADQQRVLGGDHPTTLTTRQELGYWLGQAGDTGAALAELRDVIATRERHPWSRVHDDRAGQGAG
jgi:tetratricopeptide (TPR) repeat protein